MKILEELKKNWKFYTIMVVSIILIILLMTYMVNISDKLYKKLDLSIGNSYIENVDTNTTITQKFVAEYNNLEKLYIEFEPFKESSTVGGDVLIGLKDENGDIIKEEKITRNYIRENTTYKLKFKKQKSSQGKEYELYIRFVDREKYDKFYTVKYSKENKIENYKLFINDVEEEGTISFDQLYSNNKKVYAYILTNIIIIIAVMSISIYIFKRKDIKEESIFLITVPIICIMFMATMPTFKNHDELYHWIRTYEVSTGVLATKIEDGVQGTQMPEAITAIMKSNWETITYADVNYALGIEMDKNNTYTIDSKTAAVYAFVQYIPQAIGVAIARMFTNKPLIMAYAGRIFNIIFAMFVLYKAIKLMPFGKKIFLIVSYIPIVIEGFSSLSPDAMTTSISFLYIAYILNLAFDDKKIIGVKQKIYLTILSIIVALCKIVYLPLVLLLFLIPKEKFCDTEKEVKSPIAKKVLNIILIAGIAIVINLLWLGFSSRYLLNLRGGDSKYQVLLLFQNPIKYIQELIYTFNLYGNNYLTGMLGEALGWGELIRLNFIVPSILFVLLIIELITDETLRNKFSAWQKFVIFMTFLIIFGLIFTSLYVQWTTIGSESILGVQGRYFIPILPLLMLLIGNNIKIKSDYNEKDVLKMIAITGLLINIIVILTIIINHL